MFEQRIEDGWQVEYPDFWLSYGNPWEIERKDVKYVIRFGGQCVIREENGVRKVSSNLLCTPSNKIASIIKSNTDHCRWMTNIILTFSTI